ncbi:MAG: D-glycero-beta-D-manno-heptose 1,7-bisphosphate 7-phosphatase [Gammaproteobacteria bacterium]|nr:MAG: D-glycero-beta-D-manno-heptose 1,7-bisphosphate 7-phosphatase [Gammaproteobacteria bacterium]
MLENQQKIIILDRDGVINEDSDDYIRSPKEWQPIPGSIEAIAKLCRSSYKVFVFTNQSGIARGYFDLQTLEQMHHKMTTLVEKAGGKIEKIYFCPHSPADNCNCRKPKTGMLEQLQQENGIDLQKTIVVGDSIKDIDAAIRVGATPFMVMTGKGHRFSQNEIDQRAPKVFKDLAEIAKYLC